MTKRNALLPAILMLATMQTALAAKRLGPPIEDLQSAPERIRIVTAEAREKSATARILFAVTDRLSGEAPDEVLLRTDQQTFDDVMVGQAYVVAWTYMRRNRGVIGGWEEDPDGPSTVQVLGLGSTALFDATPEMRYLFAPGAMTDPATAGQQIDALLKQIPHPDPRGRGLLILELFLRQDLTSQMTPAQAVTLKDIFQETSLEPLHRDFLFRASLQVTPELTAPWLAEEMRRTIIEHGTQYDLSSFVPRLVLTAAQGLQQVGDVSDVGLLDMLLYANNPGVAKVALTTMDHFDHAATVARAERALERGWIHSETRYELNRYLDRGKP